MKDIQKKAEELFKHLEFNEEKHEYKWKGKTGPSTSKMITKYYQKFDAKNISKAVAKKQGKTQKEILANWDKIRDEACNRGTEVHLFGEHFLNQDLVVDDPKKQAIVNFWTSLPNFYKPVFFELQMYHLEFEYFGTTDFVLLDTRDNSLVVGDYKTNKDLFKNFKGKKMKKPFSLLLDNPYNKYQVQLSFYQMMIEQFHKVSDRMLVWLKEDSTFETYHTTDLTTILKKDLDVSRGSNSTHPKFIF